MLSPGNHHNRPQQTMAAGHLVSGVQQMTEYIYNNSSSQT